MNTELSLRKSDLNKTSVTSRHFSLCNATDTWFCTGWLECGILWHNSNCKLSEISLMQNQLYNISTTKRTCFLSNETPGKKSMEAFECSCQVESENWLLTKFCKRINSLVLERILKKKTVLRFFYQTYIFGSFY